MGRPDVELATPAWTTVRAILGRRGARRTKWVGWNRSLRRTLMPITLLVLWQIVCSSGLVDPSLLPAPTTVLKSWWQWMFGERTPLAWYSGTWFEYVYLSTWRVLLGFAIAGVSGTIIGVLIGWSEIMADLFDPLVQWLKPIPMTAWLPFATFIFGIREGAAIFLIAMGAFYPIVVNCTAGAEQTPRNLVRAALMLGTAPSKLLIRVVVPAALPNIFTGLRLGIGIGWVLVIVVEMLAVKGGIGYAMWTAYQFMRIDLIIASMFTVGVLGFLTDRLLLLISRRLTRWNTGLRAR
jgi:NitT/TauT family transport system permease protein